MKLRYVNLLWLAALLLSWSAIYVAWSMYDTVMQVKINRLKGDVMILEKELEELKKGK